MARVLRGDIGWADFDPVSGREHGWSASSACDQPGRFQRAFRYGDRGRYHESATTSRLSPDTGTGVEGSAEAVVGEDQPDQDTRRRTTR